MPRRRLPLILALLLTSQLSGSTPTERATDGAATLAPATASN